jgi:hypothetical protein
VLLKVSALVPVLELVLVQELVAAEAAGDCWCWSYWLHQTGLKNILPP